MTDKERLREYIEKDALYQEYLAGDTKDLTDFDKFCIQHCKDIEKLLKENRELRADYGSQAQIERDLLLIENKELKEKFKATNKGLQKVVLKRKKWKHRYQLARCEIKELREQLEEYKDKINWYENFEVNKTIDKLRLKHNVQQKEFIKWLEKKQSFLRDEISELTLGMCNTDFQDIKIEVYENVLQKYKEIIGEKQ